jgi:hypothetical protein
MLLISQQSCKLNDEYVEDPIIPDPGTGMWFVGQISTGGEAVFVKGRIINGIQYAFVSNGSSGLSVVNISNAASPVISSVYQTNGFAKEVYIDTVNGYNFAFISDTVKGLCILNVSNPNSLSLDTLISYPGVNSVNRKNNYIFAALNNGNVKVLNISQLPNFVSEVTTYTSANTVNHIEVSGNTAFLLENVTGLELVNISNPENPVSYSTFHSPGNCYNVKVADNLVYVADGNAGISVLNVTNPSQPYFVNTTSTETNVRYIDYSPNFLFTGEGTSGVEVLNVFNTVAPESVGYYVPGGFCNSVHYFKAKVLVANGTNGLVILRF